MYIRKPINCRFQKTQVVRKQPQSLTHPLANAVGSGDQWAAKGAMFEGNKVRVADVLLASGRGAVEHRKHILNSRRGPRGGSLTCAGARLRVTVRDVGHGLGSCII